MKCNTNMLIVILGLFAITYIGIEAACVVK